MSRSSSLAYAIGLPILAQVLLQLGVRLFVAIAMLVHETTYADALHRVATDPLPLGAAQLAALAATIAFGAQLSGKDDVPREALSLRPVNKTALALAVVLGLALQLPLVELTTWVTDFVPALAHDPAQDAMIREAVRIDSPLRALTVPFAVVFVAPVTEELLFRGLILPRLRDRFGRASAIGASALLFGVFHLDPLAAVYATVMGVVLGVVADRARSVLPAIALHAGFNALPVLLPTEIAAVPGFNVEETSHVAPWLVAASAAVAAAALAGTWAAVRRAG